MDRWSNRVALVTGAGDGIGRAVAKKLAKCGMKVAALDIQDQKLEDLEYDIKNSGVKGSVKGYICDVRSESDVTAAFDGVEKDLGPISVLVNNAGVMKPVLFTDIDLEGFQAMMDVNVKGHMNCIKAGLKSMKMHNISDGHIVNVVSIAGHVIRESRFELSSYTASKHAARVLTNCLRKQLKEEGSSIRVTAISPALTFTNMTRETHVEKENRKDYLLPEDIAEAIAYALSAPKHVNVSDIIIESV